MVLGMEVGLSPHDFVLDRDPAPSQKSGGAPPQFSAHFYCGQMAGCIKMPLGMEVGLSPGDFVFNEDPAPSTKRGRSPTQFSDHVYCSQMAAWIKMPLGTEVGLGPDNIVLDGDTAPLPKKVAEPPSPIFGPCLLRPNGRMDQDGTWHGGGSWSRPYCAR